MISNRTKHIAKLSGLQEDQDGTWCATSAQIEDLIKQVELRTLVEAIHGLAAVHDAIAVRPVSKPTEKKYPITH